MRWLCLAWAAAWAAGCVPVATDGDPGTAPPPVGMAEELAPPGAGTLHQDQFTVELRSGAIQLRVTPLDEWILRLAAPDTYRRLSGLAATHRAAAQGDRAFTGGDPTLFLVSFASREMGQTFQPTDLVLESNGIELRPARIIPLTPGWGEQRLGPQQAESAVYLFDRSLDLTRPLVIRYGANVSHRWRDILPVLQEEQARVPPRMPREPGKQE